MLDRVNIVTGDFNCPKIDWSCLTSPGDGIHELLLDCVIECGFTQMVNFSTRKNSVLDLILIDVGTAYINHFRAAVSLS